MKKYKCHKVVHATPMSLGKYNTYRGWVVPEDEDPRREGYHIIYNIGIASEYHSWTTREEWESGYTEV